MIRPFLFLSLIAFLFSACDDNPTVGGRLIDDQANPSQRYALNANTSTATLDHKDIAGLKRTVLVGKVQETGALSGITTEATGYLDFGGTPVIPDRFKNNPIQQVSIEVVYKKDSVYGDTTQTMNLAIKEMTASFNIINGARYDSLLTAQSATVLQTASHRPQKRDTSFSIALPTAWVSANETNLETPTDFSTKHFGFALSSTSGNNMIGINEERTRLRMIGGDATGRDTVYYSVAAYHTYTKQTGTAAGLGNDKILLQDNTGAAFNPIFDFTLPSLQNVAVGNAAIKIYADSTAMQSVGSFNRTPLQNLSLYGISTQANVTTPILITSATFYKGAYTFTSSAFSAQIQKNLSGSPTFSRFFVVPSTSPKSTLQDASANSVYAAVLYNHNAPIGKKPELVVVYSPTN